MAAATAGAADGPRLTAYLLGGFLVTIDGVPIDMASSRRNRNVLAYLITHRRSPLPRDILTEAFWPGAEPGAARNRLHVALSGVRQALRAVSPYPVLERRFDTYRIAPSVAVWTDVEHFGRYCEEGLRAELAGSTDTATRCYEAACHLYQGDFLADDPYAEWATETRNGLRLQAVETQCRLMGSYTEAGDYGPATLLGRRILALDPCNEQVHQRLITCYAAAGQRHLALSQYHRLATMLWETFRVRPSAETLALYHGLHQPSRPERHSA